MNKDNELLSLPSLVSPKNEEDNRISFSKEYMSLNYDYGVGKPVIDNSRLDYSNKVINFGNNSRKESFSNNNQATPKRFNKEETYNYNDTTNNYIKSTKPSTAKKNTPSTAKTSTAISKQDNEHDHVLLNKINELEDTITNISNELYLSQTVNKGEEYVQAEINLWKNKIDYITNYHNKHVVELQENIYRQECEFKDDLSNLQENNKMILYNLEMAYKSLLHKTEREIEELREEKNDLVSKTENIKKVFNLK